MSNVTRFPPRRIPDHHRHTRERVLLAMTADELVAVLIEIGADMDIAVTARASRNYLLDNWTDKIAERVLRQISKKLD